MISERFKVTTFVTKELLGETIAALTRLGLTEVNFDLVSEEHRFGRAPKAEVPAREVLLEWLKDHPTFKANEVCKLFEARGHSTGYGYQTLTAAVADGILTKEGMGLYARADVKKLAPPKKSDKPKPEKKTFNRPGTEIVLTYARRNHGRINTAKLKEIFANEGRAVSSVYPTLNELLKANLIERVGDSGSGSYKLIEKKPAAKKPAPAAKPAAELPATEMEIA